MEWNGMEWNGMEWNGMEWNGMEWVEHQGPFPCNKICADEFLVMSGQLV